MTLVLKDNVGLIRNITFSSEKDPLKLIYRDFNLVYDRSLNK